MKNFYNLYSNGKDLYELNKNIFKKAFPGYWNIPHILIVDENKIEITKEDYDEFEEYISKNILNILPSKLNSLCDISSPYISYAVLNENIKAQIKLFKPLLVIAFGENAKNTLLNDAQFNKFYKIDDIYYYPLLSQDSEAYYLNAKKEINEFMKTHALIQITNHIIFYRDIDGNKLMYENPIKKVLTYYPHPEGKYLSIFEEPLQEGQGTYQSNFFPEEVFGVGKDIDFVKFYKFLVYDIETNFCNTPLNPEKELLSVTTYNPVLNKYNILVLNNHTHSFPSIYHNVKVLSYDTEEELLQATLKLFSNFDVVTGWFVNTYDILYIINRAKFLGINIKEYLPQYPIYNDFRVSEYVPHFNGLYSIDLAEIFKFIAGSYTSEDSTSVSRGLSNVGQLILGESKVDLPPSQIPVVWENNVDKFLEYALQDVHLTWGIMREAKLFDVLFTKQNIAKMNFDKVLYNSYIIENLLLRSFPQYKFPGRNTVKVKDESITGGLVFPAISGLYKNVIVYDFSGMYPSLITTFNLSPDMLTSLNNSPNKNNNVKIDNIEFSTHRLGLITILEKELKVKRKVIKNLEEKASGSLRSYYNMLQGSIKNIMNSMYGVELYPRFLLYNRDVGQTITNIGQKMITYTKNYIESKSLKVLYGDTDSVFVKFPDNLTLEELEQEAKKILNELNTELYNFARIYNNDEKYLKANFSITLDIDKLFSKFYITDAKKRYFGYLENNNEHKIYVKGFEVRRHDTPSVFKNVYKKIYAYILDENQEELIQYILSFKDYVKTLSPENFIINVKLGKNITEYEKDYELIRAVKSVNNQFQRGDILNLIYTLNGPIHYQGQDIKIDYNKYFEKFILNKLQFLNIQIYNNVMKIINNQKTLDSFINF
jgi:DNA polymerase elongation subunit (family B)